MARGHRGIMRVNIRVDGGGWRGMGHVARAEAIAVELLALGARVTYATRTAEVLPRLARRGPTILLVGPDDAEALAAMRADRVVVDLPYPLRVPGASHVARSHCGDWSRAVVGRPFRPRPRHQRGERPRVYISGGGTDHHGLLVPLLEAAGLMRSEPDLVVADGSLADPAAAMARCDLALVAYGVTALELAAVGVPALWLAATDGHARGARALEATGCGRHLGLRGHVGEGTVAAEADALLEDRGRLAGMALAGPEAIDGRGAERVAREILGV